ncbi:MAG: tyrosine-type recombinase/integrase [Candidatus Margulisiibacteriota bacterium]|jgi:site-specific recombinase XerD
MKNIKYNSENEITKTKFFEMLTNAKGRDPKTVNSYAKAIHEFELHTGFKSFKKFEIKQAISFKEYLANKKNKRTGFSISKSYLQHYTSHVREFFEWLERQKGYSRYIKYDDVQYFNITRNDRNRAKATAYQESYDISEILSTIRNMPNSNEIENRNKAMISLNLLTTPRISALQTAHISSIKYFKGIDAWAFLQNPNQVNTKYAKNITAYFIGDLKDIYDNVLSWVEYLKSKGFSDKDPLFPKIVPSFNNDGMQVLILEKQFIKSQSTIRQIFENAFKNNNLSYLKPHSFRHSIVRKAMKSTQSSLLISALNQNMGHAMDIGTIISSYGTSPEPERAGILKNFELE